MSSNAWREAQLPSLRLVCLADRRLGLEGRKPWTPSFALSLGMRLALNNYREEGRGGKRRTGQNPRRSSGSSAPGCPQTTPYLKDGKSSRRTSF